MIRRLLVLVGLFALAWAALVLLRQRATLSLPAWGARAGRGDATGEALETIDEELRRPGPLPESAAMAGASQGEYPREGGETITPPHGDELNPGAEESPDTH